MEVGIPDASVEELLYPDHIRFLEYIQGLELGRRASLHWKVEEIHFAFWVANGTGILTVNLISSQTGHERANGRGRKRHDVSGYPYGWESENVWEKLISPVRVFYAWHTQATLISTAKLSGRESVCACAVAGNDRACLRREACRKEEAFLVRLCLVVAATWQAYVQTGLEEEAYRGCQNP